MLMTKLDKNFDIVLGNERDICFYCLQEHHKEYPNQDVISAKKEMEGQLLNRPVYKNRRIGEGFIVCKHHIGKIAEAIGYTLTQEEEQEVNEE